MADNITFPVPDGTQFAADQVGGVYVERAKVVFGPDNSFSDVSATNPLPVDDQSGVGTLSANAAAITVDATSGGVILLAANASRWSFVIQNVGSASIMVGKSGVTATSGLVQLDPGGVWAEEGKFCPKDEIRAIRIGSVSGSARAVEITKS